MAKSPFYRVITQRREVDLTNFIKSFSLVDSVEQSDVLSLSMEGVDISLVDDRTIANGVILIYSFGYYQGAYSGERRARISNVSVNYGKVVTISIKATDLGIVLKKGRKKRVWQNLSSREIIEQVASEKGLNADIQGAVSGVDQLSRKIEFFPQTNETDYDMIKKLMSISGNGEFIVYTRGQSLVVKPRSLSENSRRTFTYNEENGGIISFSVKEQDTSKSEFSAKSSVVSINPFDGEELVSETENENSPESKLGNHSSKYIVQGAENYSDVAGRGVEPEPVEGELHEPVADSTEARTKSNKKNIDSSLNDVKASLSIEGDPILRADRVITVSNVAQKHQGNWYVVKITHKVDSTSFITTMELQRNATNKPTNESETAELSGVNSSVGNSSTNNTVQLSRFIVE